MKKKNRHFPVDKYRVREGSKVDLKKWSTKDDPVYKSKADYAEILRDQISQMSDLQEMMYAHNKYAVLFIFQAMDAAGKDGTISHVMSGINPTGCQVYSFKQPSSTELEHDFLWRTYVSLPERGRIGIFNRSYYEEVLVVKVHPTILNAQNLPDELRSDKNIWDGRYESIRDMERHLHRSGTRIVKFFLNLSKDEQRKRFLARIDEPAKNWKFSGADLEERKFWDDYQQAYAKCLSETSTDESPWYVIPADDKENARLLVSEVIVNTLSSLKMNYPEVDEAHRAELKTLRAQLTKD